MRRLTNYNLARSIICTIILALVVITAIFSGSFTFAEEINTFDTINVMDDLRSSKDFDINKYPYNEHANPSIMNFVEYCYSFTKAKQGNYGLYLYIYNPQGLDWDIKNKGNKVEMKVGTDNGGNDVYEKFELEYLSKCDEPTFKNLFYKFKVIDHKSEHDGMKIVERVNSNSREYAVSSIELVTKGEANAKDYTIGGRYIFTGYAKGYGVDPTAENSLKCTTFKDLETLQIDVSSTYYRSGVSSLGKYHQTDLNSVYFGVPKATIKKYGRLQKIAAEWWEYKTAPLIFCNKESYVTDFNANWVGKVMPNNYNENNPYKVYYGSSRTGTGMYYEWAYNQNEVPILTIVDKKVNQLCFMEYANVKNFTDFTYSGAKIHDYFLNYNKSAVKGYLPIKNGQISADLFSDTVDSGRTRGYNFRNFDADDVSDQFNLLSYDTTHSGWDKFWDYFFRDIDTNDIHENLSPIYAVTDKDLTGTDAEISKNLCINTQDVSALKTQYNMDKLEGKQTYLFRYSATDYYARDLVVQKRGDMITSEGMLAEMTAIFDFDILYMTFNKDGDYTVIPVVSDPIDQVGDITGIQEGTGGLWDKIVEFFKNIGKIILLVLLVLLLIPFLPILAKLLVYIITLPFKLIAWIIGLFKKNNKGEKNK